jgi:hypothetical protein
MEGGEGTRATKDVRIGMQRDGPNIVVKSQREEK